MESLAAGPLMQWQTCGTSRPERAANCCAEPAQCGELAIAGPAQRLAQHAAPAHAKPDYEARSGTWPHSWVLLRHNALAVAPAPAHGHTLTAQLAAS